MENEHKHHHTEHKKEEKFTLSIPAAIIVAGLIIAGAIFATKSPTVVSDKQVEKKVSVNIADVMIAGEPYIGNPDAKPIAYFSDYQCPFCKKFETNEMQKIVDDYVVTGKVRLVFKDFVFLGPDSNDAAIYGRAVWKLYPEKYYEWREAMYNAQDEEHGGFGNRASIEELTRTIEGIDQKKVSADVDENLKSYEVIIKAAYDESLKLGVTGTPAVIIGKELVSGAHQIDEYVASLKKYLK